MNTISQYVPQTVIDCAKYTKDTLAPIAIKNIASLGVEVLFSSWFFKCSRENIAVAAILRKSFEAVGDEGISYLERNYKLDPKHKSVLKVANTGLSFFASYFTARTAGYELPIGLVYNASAGAALQLYMIALGDPLQKLFSMEDPYKDNANIVEITKDNFQEKVKNSKLPTIISVYSILDPFCKRVAPIFTEAAKELEGKVNFAKINVDQEELVKALNIENLPTFLFFKDGKKIHTHAGMTKKEHFSGLIKRLHLVEESKDLIKEEKQQLNDTNHPSVSVQEASVDILVPVFSN